MKRSFLSLLLVAALVLFFVSVNIFTILAQDKDDYSNARINWQSLKGETINILVTNAHYFNKFRAITPEFTKLTGIQVKFDVVPPREMREKAILDLSMKTGIYCSHTADPMYLPLYVANGWIEPMDKYIDNKEITDKEWFQLEDIIPLWREADTVNGKLYAMPVEGEVTILVYRKDIFEKLGLKPATTLEELKENTKKVHNYEKNLAGIAIRGFRGAGQNMYIWPSLFKSWGGDWFDNENNSLVDSNAGVEALKYYVEMLKNYGPAGVENWNWPEIMEAFAGGNVAQFLDSNSTASVLENSQKSKVAGKVGYARWPKGPSGKRVASIWNWAMPINSFISDQKKQATWLYIQWLASKKTQMDSAIYKESADAVLRTGVNRFSIWESQEYRKALGFEKNYFDVVLESLQYDTDANWRPRLPQWPDIGETMAIAIQSALVGQKTPQQALKDAAAKINEMMK